MRYKYPYLFRSSVFLVVLIILTRTGWGKSNSTGYDFIQDSIIPSRFIPAVSLVAAGYTGFSYGLYQSWYAPYRSSSFHLYNDWNEWRNMDKAGHFYTAYFQSALLYESARWVGLNKRKSLWTASGLSLLFLSTIELMDGYSEGWGYSHADMAANIAGVLFYAGQQSLLGQQIIRVKWSSLPLSPPDYYITGSKGNSISLEKRIQTLYGGTLVEQLLKNYNATHIWLSFSLPETGVKPGFWPDWLSLAIGLGAGNMYGGFRNEWVENEERFALPEQDFPRYTSLYISPDIHWQAIPSKKRWVKHLFTVLNIFKFPAPALEYRSTGKIKWHWLFF